MIESRRQKAKGRKQKPVVQAIQKNIECSMQKIDNPFLQFLIFD